MANDVVNQCHARNRELSSRERMFLENESSGERKFRGTKVPGPFPGHLSPGS